MHTGLYINLPIGAVVWGLLILLRVPEVRPKPPVREELGKAVSKTDLIGSVLLWPAAIIFFLALQWGGNRYAWDTPTVIGLLVGRRGHICGVSQVGVPPWRRRAAAVSDAASAGYFLRLGNHVLLHERYVRPALLPAALLPGCQEQHSAYKRCTHLADDHQPGHPCYVVRAAE